MRQVDMKTFDIRDKSLYKLNTYLTICPASYVRSHIGWRGELNIPYKKV